MKYTVQQLDRKDIQQYIALTRFTDNETNFLGVDPEEKPPTMLQVLSRIKAGRQVVFVASDEQGLIGHLGAFWRRGKNARAGHCITIGLAVMKDFWGKGIGNQLMNAIEEWAAENNIVRIELEVMAHNERGIALYKKRGFELEGLKKKSVCVNGEYKDEYMMAKIIG
jgi:RimJ/RimL family protein N-acetyltransferase